MYLCLKCVSNKDQHVICNIELFKFLLENFLLAFTDRSLTLTEWVTSEWFSYLGTVREVKEVSHDSVSEAVVAVGQQEHFGAALPDPRQEHWQPLILLYVLVKVSYCLWFQITL